MKRKILITSGDPAGCGPRIILEAISQLRMNCSYIIVGDAVVFERLPLFKRFKTQITLIDVSTPGIGKIRRGIPSRVTGRASLSYLDTAVRLIKHSCMQQLVTAPVSKEAIQCIAPDFTGHTEYLAHAFGVRDVAMMMTSRQLRLVLLTRHIPFAGVSTAITGTLIRRTLSLVHDSLKRQFKIPKPRIVFASLNPHAGIHTFLAKEEKIISDTLRTFNYPLTGPLPADTIFIQQNLRNFDCIVCAYHDQGMIPFKLLSFDDGVNLTLGLPIIRTSPAHGVAFDRMRSNARLSSTSMAAALRLAARLLP